jgi:hypothetical protein
MNLFSQLAVNIESIQIRIDILYRFRFVEKRI